MTTFWTAAAAAHVFCFWGTILLTYLSDTLNGKDPLVFYFSQDHFNLFLYFLVCPLYVGAAASIVRIAASSWSEIAAIADKAGKPDLSVRHPARTWVFCFLVLAIACGLTISYMHSAIGVLTPRAFWFETRPAILGQPSFNLAGVYYIILNFSLLCITMIGVMSYVSLGMEATRWVDGVFSNCGVGDDGNRLEDGQDSLSDLHFQAEREVLKSFSLAFSFAKILTIMYIINIMVWELSPLGGNSFNMLVALLAVYFIGGYLVILPHDYIEVKWKSLVSRWQLQIRSQRDHLDERANRLAAELALGQISIDDYTSALSVIEGQKQLIKDRYEAVGRENSPPSITRQQRWANFIINALFPTSLFISVALLPQEILRSLFQQP